MPSYVAAVAHLVLFALLLSIALSPSTLDKSPLNSRAPLLVGLVRKNITELHNLTVYLGLALLCLPNFLAHKSAAILLLSVGATGLLLRNLYAFECNCYGTLADRRSKYRHIVPIMMFLSSFALLVANTSTQFETTVYMVTLFLVLLVTSAKRGFIELTVTGPDRPRSPAGDPKVLVGLSTDTVLAKREGVAIKVADYACDERLLIVIGTSEECSACQSAKPALLILATAFAENVTTLNVVAGEDKETSSQIDALSPTFMIPGYPFALLIDPVAGAALSPVIHAPDRIWMLYYIAVSRSLAESESDSEAL